MVKWYRGLHVWNRVALTASVVAPLIKAIIGNLILEWIIVSALVAAAMWACGWAMIAAGGVIRNRLIRC